MKVILNSPKETDKFAKDLAKELTDGDVIALYGDLGAGKTYFTSCLCKHLGSNDTISSPSYLIMHEYEGSTFPIHHLDLYRFSAEEEVLELGLEEIFENGITIIEWPEIAEFILPKKTIKLYWKIEKDKRIVTLKKPA